MAPLLDAPGVDWACPNCDAAERTPALPPNASRFHSCPGLHGLTAPLVRAEADCAVTAVPRGDYLRGAVQRHGDDGQPYMAVRTEHADGHTDLVVFPEVAVFGAVTGLEG